VSVSVRRMYTDDAVDLVTGYWHSVRQAGRTMDLSRGKDNETPRKQKVEAVSQA
jgi:hypothetical protein